MNRRGLFIFMVAAATAVFVLWAAAQPSAQAANPLYPPGIGFNPAVDYTKANFAYSPNIRKFVDSLPGLGYANRNNLQQYIPVAIPDTTTYPDADYYVLAAQQYTIQMNSDLPATGTLLRGYAQLNTTDPHVANVAQFLGPAIIARVFDPTKPAGVNRNGKPVRILFQNQLPLVAAGNFFLPLDPTIMGAGMGPTAGQSFTHNRVTIPHLHGGHTPWISDGTPHQWVTPVGEVTPYQKGVSFVNVPDMVGAGNTPGGVPKSIPSPAPGDGLATLFWSNQQSARLMFYHDHAWGTTRLNVYGGMAAPYLLVDQVEEDLIAGTNFSGGNPAGTQILPDGAAWDKGGTDIYRYGIPLVIQDKAFVNDAKTPPGAGFPLNATATSWTVTTDPLWATYVNTIGGNLWFPHEYMPIENIFDPSGNTPNGRWDYAPFMIPPMVPNILTLPSPTLVPEAFGDTAVVNGTAFPYVELPPDVVRFRILAAGNDRVFNLQLYKADPANTTEVKMVPAAPNASYPTWPKDGRDGGVPDPTTAGPPWIHIGNESGLLAQADVIAQQPIDFEYNRQSIPFAGVTSHALLLMPAQRADVLVDLRGYTDGDILILYNDAPAPMPFFWPINDFYAGDPDQTVVGGAPSTPAGFGPNTRTLMQIRIKGTTTPTPYNQNFSVAAVQTAIPKAFAVAQPKPLVPQLTYNAAFPGFATIDIYGQSVDMSINVTGAAGPVTKIRTTVPGNGYATPPGVTFVGGGGSGAAATAGLNPCGGINLLTSGTGYTSPPAVTVGAPGAGGVRCTAAATISGGQVTAISIVEPGSNYSLTVAPAVTITGGGGTGATASAMVATAGIVGSITITNGGSGYTRQPQVYLTGGGGMGASAVALIGGAVPYTYKNITEGFDVDYGRMDIRLGSTPNPLTPTVGAGFVMGIARYIDPPTEIVNDGELTLWRLTHLGVDSHALHFHLFDVQVVNRVDWTNVVKPPYADELGWRDTIRTNPMEDIFVAFRPKSMVLPFQLPQSNRLLDPSTPLNSTTNFFPVPPPLGVPAVAQLSNVMTNFGWEYVWHCHMLGHEENDFMRPMVLIVVPPGAPTTLTATSTPTTSTASANLHWTVNSTNENGFIIQRASNSGFTTGLTTTTNYVPQANAFTDTTPAFNTRYYYRVAAWDAAGNSGWSNTATVTTPRGPVPLAPTNLTAGTLTTRSAVLNWTMNGANTGVVIQQAANSTFTGRGVRTTNINTANVATTTINRLRTLTTYYFRVAEKNANGNSAWSNVLIVTTP